MFVCQSTPQNLFHSGSREKEALPDRPDESSEVGSTGTISESSART